MQRDEQSASQDDGKTVPPGIDPGQLDATFPDDDLGELIASQHNEIAGAGSPLTTPVLPGTMRTGLRRGALIGALVGLVVGAVVGVILASASFGSLAAFWTVLIPAVIGAAVGGVAGAVYDAPRSAEIADERQVARERR